MATTLKDVQDSMSGTLDTVLEQIHQPHQSYADSLAMPNPTAKQMYHVFKLVRKGQKRLTLDGICRDVKNPSTGKFETIRLIRDAHSIWSSDLTEFLKDKEHISKNRIGLQFLNGICRIPVDDVHRLEYARMHKSNVGTARNGSGKYDFYEYDAAEEQKMRYDKQMKRISLIQSIGGMNDDKIVKLALYLGIKPNDDEIGLPKTMNGFKTELLVMADTQPERVGTYIDSREVEVSYLVRKAIMESKIDLGGSTGNIIWAAGKGFICKLPQARKPLEYLTELAMTNNKEGNQFKEQLETLIT